MLDFDKLEEYQDYLVQIRNTKTGELIEGLLDNEDFSYTTSAELGTNFMAQSIEDVTRGGAQAIAGRIPGVGDYARSAIGQNYKTIRSTYKAYEGASDTPFSLQLHIFANKKSYNQSLQILHKFTQPDTEDSKYMHSYLYDKSEAASMLTGEDPFSGNLIHVSIGDWFFATGLFCTGIDYSFSKYVDTEGKPIYLVVNLGFVPYKVLNAQELASWIRR